MNLSRPGRPSAITAALSALALAFLLSACGSGDSQTPTTTGSDSLPPPVQESPGPMDDPATQDPALRDPGMQQSPGVGGETDQQGIDQPQGLGGEPQ